MAETTTRTLPILPLPSGVVLPGMVVTIGLESEEARAAVDAAGPDRTLVLVPKVNDRFAKVGVIAHVEDEGTLPDGTAAIVIRAEQRAALGLGTIGTGTATWVQVESIDESAPTDRTEDLASTYRATARTLLERLGGRRLTGLLRDVETPGALADTAGWWPDLSLDRKVELLETIDVDRRLEKVTAWTKEALAEYEVADKIRHDVTDGMEKQQREFLLRQQLAAIRKELGEGGDDDDVVEQFRAKLEVLIGRSIPDAPRRAIEREIDRLERTSPQNQEHGWIRAWLDTVLEIPFGVRSDDNFSLAHARTVLDADHTGLDEVKDRIVEDLAVRKLRADRAAVEARDLAIDLDVPVLHTSDDAPDDPTDDVTEDPTDLADDLADDRTADDRATGEQAAGADELLERETRPAPTILVLAGPPGVGKTSLGASIARALGRTFVRVALGGVRDEADIRGHRRTYVGAKEGRIARALIDAGTMNPVFLLDEIDKVGSDWRGDPSAALLEVLDPAQNHTFRDHYLEIELDLSDVLFIATANQLDTIPGPLLDRMEIITIDGYTEAEKVAIARDHLVPRLVKRTGLRIDEVDVTEAAVATVIADYTREAGVRGLERQLGKVLRKAATAIAVDADKAAVEAASKGQSEDGAQDEAEDTGAALDAHETAARVVDVAEVTEALGRPRFHRDEANREPTVGVVNGLAVTGAGGDVLIVEATAMDGEGPERGSLVLTGQLGDVMNESGQIALSFIRSQRETFGIDAAAFGRRFHVHFPAGAVPKDGPSAGVTMSTALVSLLTGRPVKASVGMTGEVTLQGNVLPIGGVKQKLLAAHRAGLTDVVIPKANEPDLDDLPDAVRDELRIHPVAHVREVIAIALEDIPSEGAVAA